MGTKPDSQPKHSRKMTQNKGRLFRNPLSLDVHFKRRMRLPHTARAGLQCSLTRACTAEMCSGSISEVELAMAKAPSSTPWCCFSDWVAAHPPAHPHPHPALQHTANTRMRSAHPWRAHEAERRNKPSALGMWPEPSAQARMLQMNGGWQRIETELLGELASDGHGLRESPSPGTWLPPSCSTPIHSSALMRSISSLAIVSCEMLT